MKFSHYAAVFFVLVLSLLFFVLTLAVAAKANEASFAGTVDSPTLTKGENSAIRVKSEKVTPALNKQMWPPGQIELS